MPVFKGCHSSSRNILDNSHNKPAWIISQSHRHRLWGLGQDTVTWSGCSESVDLSCILSEQYFSKLIGISATLGCCAVTPLVSAWPPRHALTARGRPSEPLATVTSYCSTSQGSRRKWSVSKVNAMLLWTPCSFILSRHHICLPGSIRHSWSMEATKEWRLKRESSQHSVFKCRCVLGWIKGGPEGAELRLSLAGLCQCQFRTCSDLRVLSEMSHLLDLAPQETVTLQFMQQQDLVPGLLQSVRYMRWLRRLNIIKYNYSSSKKSFKYVILQCLCFIMNAVNRKVFQCAQ